MTPPPGEINESDGHWHRIWAGHSMAHSVRGSIIIVRIFPFGVTEYFERGNKKETEESASSISSQVYLDPFVLSGESYFSTLLHLCSSAGVISTAHLNSFRFPLDLVHETSHKSKTVTL
jgi:hypothetical protein